MPETKNGEGSSQRQDDLLPDPCAAFPVVGAGASSGGLGPLTEFLQELPVDTGMAFVIVQHLAPDRQSDLTAILSRATKMPVSEVSDEPEVQPDHVYVIPPGRDMFISDGKLRLLPQEKRTQQNGIDQFFRSLAAECGHKAIGVILSGSLSDGTMGIEAIKAAGGITFAQDATARHDSMPKSAVASGCVDFVLPPAEIAREIARIARHPYVAPGERVSEESPDEPAHARIAEIVHRKTGADFLHYKSNTLIRRIKRRMVLHKLDTPREYEEHLRETPEEVEALFQDILINVTSFFRDEESFGALVQNVFPKLLAKRSRQDPLRVWTLGCSTGQEAYSIAMALTECSEAADTDSQFQIFATDLNNTGIAYARAGLYPKSISEEVSPARLEKFFTEEENGYRICKSIREHCIFSRHNVLGDPPFSRVDFISCRNVLIYMEPVLQQQIMPLLHYALKPGGFLWLGNSETVGTSRLLFEVEDSRHKIFTRQPGPGPADWNYQRRSTEVMGSRLPPGAQARREAPRREMRAEVERILLTRYAPPGVVISPRMEIVQYRGDTGAYLAPAPGAPSVDLLKMLREGLLMGVRAAILKAAEQGRPVRDETLRVKAAGGYRPVAVEVIPVTAAEDEEGGFLVLFEEVRPPVGKDVLQTPVDTRGEDEISRLTLELVATRDYLKSVIEQQEVVNAELQVANEEAQSANEEMQSVNEELETSKEEIQSSNEELATINDELNNRNTELNKLNHSLRLARDYAESIIASVRSPLVVLDSELRVKTASAAFYQTFHTKEAATVGRLIYDLGDGQWNIPALRVLLEEVLPGEGRVEDFEVSHNFEKIGPRVMLLNVRHLSEGDANGSLIVLAIEDITGRRMRETSLATRADDLVQADRTKDEFLAMLAHELRNPLAPLRNAAEILKSTAGDALRHEQAHAILSRQIENMSRMLDDLLDVSRITKGKIELRKQVVSLDTILTAAVSLARAGCDAQGQELEITLPAEEIFLDADATRLDQVFANLLTNACKYGEPGCHISLTAERSVAPGTLLPEVTIRVRDNGPGIAPDLLPRIFDLFVQATRSLDRSHGGLGIGLTLVQRIVGLHGGRVEALSEGIGHGCEFVVHLPALARGAKGRSPAPATRTLEISRKMLVVDDNHDSAESMAMLQSMNGHETRVAHDGPAAITIAREFLPDVMLLDIGLPGMNGFEVAKNLRQIPELDGLFLVALSGYGSDADRATAKEAGFDEYLVKPADLSLLRQWLVNLP